MEVIGLLMALPIVAIVLTPVLTIVISIFTSTGVNDFTVTNTFTPMPDGKEYEQVFSKDPVPESKTRAEQLDPRFTNLCRNPWENIV